MRDVNEINKALESHEKRIQILEALVLPTKRESISKKAMDNNPDNLILNIVNKISECDESEEIRSKILDKTSLEGKILLCFYISDKYFDNAWLNTGNIQKITSDLGIKIDARNATNKIKKIGRYLESGAARKKGQPTPYRINRKGMKRFEEIINAAEK